MHKYLKDLIEIKEFENFELPNGKVIDIIKSQHEELALYLDLDENICIFDIIGGAILAKFVKHDKLIEYHNLKSNIEKINIKKFNIMNILKEDFENFL